MTEIIDETGQWLDDESPHQFGLRKGPTDETGESTYVLEFDDENTLSLGLTISEVLAIQRLLKGVYVNIGGELSVVNEQD